MLIRRCVILLIEPRERLEFAFDSVLEGGDGMRPKREWLALAPHLDAEVPLETGDIEPLGTIPVHAWTEFGEVAKQSGETRVRRLLALGLVIGDADEFTVIREKDEALRATHWHSRAAVAHAFGRWQGVTSGEEVRSIGIVSVADLVERLGTPPAHFHARIDAEKRIPLAGSAPTSIDTLLRTRTTCRNYDATRLVPFDIFGHLLRRTFGAQAAHAVDAETAIVKKTSPSAGGLHPTEAYLLVQHVENVSPGLYHYHARDHALEPLRSLTAQEARTLAGEFLAQQEWFAEAHVIIALAPRFKRSFWKYRDHAKVYRAVTLDVGHLSQTLQISATEFGLGAFVTAAINEVDIERALGLDAMRESPLAVCGFGWRAQECARMEFDPQHAVWP